MAGEFLTEQESFQGSLSIVETVWCSGLMLVINLLQVGSDLRAHDKIWKPRDGGKKVIGTAPRAGNKDGAVQRTTFSKKGRRPAP
jgi:hypothetical protein